MGNRVEAVVFDCDGVLIDSERVSMRVTRRILAELGWDLGPEEVARRFLGCTEEFFRAEIEGAVGRTLAPDWQRPYRPWFEEALAAELTAIDGIEDAIARIEALGLPTAVASNSSRAAIARNLDRVGLHERFRGRIRGSEDVERGKPSPDVYLSAAALLGADPAACVAVEDSAVGARAARAAGMRVFAYRTALTPRGWFERPEEGITVFGAMAELPGLIAALER